MGTTRINRSRRLWIVRALKTICVILMLDASRYFTSLIPPGTAREMLVRLTELPIPLIVQDGTVWDQCYGLFLICMDYSARASGRLGRKGCERVIGAAVMRGYLPLPFRPGPGQWSPPRVEWPDKGFYRFERSDNTQRIEWIDSESCRIFASYSNW